MLYRATSPTDTLDKVRGTISYLRLCQQARKAGHSLSHTRDPVWLVDMAINRRAGWPDDPGLHRGSCQPVAHRGAHGPAAGHYPRKAVGESFIELERIAWRANGTRVLVEAREIPREWRQALLTRNPNRYEGAEDFLPQDKPAPWPWDVPAAKPSIGSVAPRVRPAVLSVVEGREPRTMAETIAAGELFHVEISSHPKSHMHEWVTGYASAADAVQSIVYWRGQQSKSWGARHAVPLDAVLSVRKHLPGSRFGCSFLGEEEKYTIHGMVQ